MEALIHWAQAHPAMLTYAGLWLLSSLAQTMPPPTDKSGPGYIWLHNLIQLAAANVKFMKLPNAMPKPPA